MRTIIIVIIFVEKYQHIKYKDILYNNYGKKILNDTIAVK